MVPGKQGEAAGDIGIEGTAIEAPTEASLLGMVFVHMLQGWQSTSDSYMSTRHKNVLYVLYTMLSAQNSIKHEQQTSGRDYLRCFSPVNGVLGSYVMSVPTVDPFCLLVLIQCNHTHQ